MKYRFAISTMIAVIGLGILSGIAKSSSLDCWKTRTGKECRTRDKAGWETGKFGCTTNPKTKTTTCRKIY